MLKLVKIRLANFLLSYLFNATTENDFLVIRFTNKEKGDGDVFRGGLKVHEDQKKNWAEEARIMQRLTLWKVLLASMQTHAKEMMFNKSATIDDILFPKASLYTIDVIEKKVENLSQLK